MPPANEVNPCRGPQRTEQHGPQKAFRLPGTLMQSVAMQQPVAVVLHARQQEPPGQLSLLQGTSSQISLQTGTLHVNRAGQQ